jgi:excisionase family DNA binding protein
MQRYERGRSYSEYTVTDRDEPLLTVSHAATRLGRSTQTVRAMIRRGELPFKQTDHGYNPRYLIPSWAVEGLSQARGLQLPRTEQQIGPASRPYATNDRVRSLENALLAIREAREHEIRARDLHVNALKELQRANDLLHAAVTGVLLPDHAPDSVDFGE